MKTDCIIIKNSHILLNKLSEYYVPKVSTLKSAQLELVIGPSID